MLNYFIPQIIPPIIMHETTQYPPAIRTYFQLLLSYNEPTPITGKAKNNPDRKPCSAPCLNVLNLVP